MPPETCFTESGLSPATILHLPRCLRLQGVRLTEKERRDLEYKEQVYRLAVERKKQLGELGCCCVHRSGLSWPPWMVDCYLLTLLRTGFGAWRLAASADGYICLIHGLPVTVPPCNICLYCLQMSWRPMTTTTCPAPMTTPRRGGHKSTRC